MNAAAWFMLGLFALFAVGMLAAVLIGARRDREIESDAERQDTSPRAHPRWGARRMRGN